MLRFLKRNPKIADPELTFWQKKQEYAAPSRYYGDGGTIHHTVTLDVEVHEGKVVAVWFRCQMLPWKQHDVEEERAKSMLSVTTLPSLTGVEVYDAR